MSDEETLVRSVIGGDQTAFRHLYERYANALFQFLLRRTPDRETAEDLVQEAFVRIWQTRDRLNPNRSFRGYLYQIARNLAIDALRARKFDVGPLSGLETAPEVDSERFFTTDRVRRGLAALTGQQRTVFCLSRFDGLTYREIAEVLDISVKTVEVHMGRALKSLRENLKDLARLIFFTPFW